MSKKRTPDSSPRGRYAYDGLDRTIHERARLGIVASLAAHPEGLSFAELKQLCDLTDGNLARHLQVLEESGLVQSKKGTQEGRPQTVCRLTRAGREQLLSYLAVLETVVADAAAARDESPGKSAGKLRPGWSPGT